MTDLVVISSRLHELEAVIETGLASFVQVGNALLEIRRDELYRVDGFDGFVEYLGSKPWGIGPTHAYQQIDAARVSAIAEIQNESQARVLAPLMRKATPEVVRGLYQEAIAEGGGTTTAKALKEKVQAVIHQADDNGGAKRKKQTRSKVDNDLMYHLAALQKLIPRWEPRFVDPHKPAVCRKRVKAAEDISEWLTETFVPAHEAKVTPLASIPR